MPPTRLSLDESSVMGFVFMGPSFQVLPQYRISQVQVYYASITRMNVYYTMGEHVIASRGRAAGLLGFYE